MSTPDPQHPADPPADGPHSGEAAATEQPPGPSFEKPTTQVPTPPYDQPTTPTYGTATAQPYDPLPGQPYDPLPGQAYDPRTGLPLGPPPGSEYGLPSGSPYGPQGTSAYNAPYGTPPGYGPQQPGWYPPPGTLTTGLGRAARWIEWATGVIHPRGTLPNGKQSPAVPECRAGDALTSRG